MDSLDSHNFERKKGEPICLKTKLKDVPINPKLYKTKRSSVSELINQPSTIKKKIFNSIFCRCNEKRINKYILND